MNNYNYKKNAPATKIYATIIVIELSLYVIQ